MACSTKKDNFATRNFQALNTKYNVLYNGGVAFDKGLATVKAQYIDNFWEVLPVERQQPLSIDKKDGDTPKNADFEKAELKATKAIQRRSMNIDGSEKNTQIDEAYLMLGKSRYNDQRFIPALEAFNYILYKYPKSDKIYDARIWVEKTNMRLDNDNLALINLSELLGEIKLKNQTYADANAILAQAFIKTEQKDSAISRLSKAIEFTKIDEEKARFRYIKGQLYELLNQKESAYSTYQEIIDMNRKSPKIYSIHAQTRQAMQFDFAQGDTVTFLENYNKLLLDRENRPFLDVLNHQLGLYYDKGKNTKQAIFFYNKSLRCKSSDTYLEASNFRNIADIYFYGAKYVSAGKYYDSTMTKLKPRSKEFNFIKKKRENLEEVIKYEGIAVANDSILNVLSMSDSEKTKFYDDFISKIKDKEAKQKILDEKAKIKSENLSNVNNGQPDVLESAQTSSKKPSAGPPKPDAAINNFTGKSNFYFYNPATVAFGKLEFRKNWGDRKLKENWRNSVLASSSNNIETENINSDEVDEITAKSKSTEIDAKYNSKTYIAKLPIKQSEIDVLIKDRNYAYYQLGVIYKEKFKEYKLATDKHESLLTKNPEERLILPTMYNLYKIYEITDVEKAAAMKAEIIKKHPNSRYAQILLNGISEEENKDSPDGEYSNLYRMFKNEEYRNLVPLVEKAVLKYTGDEIQPKFELLRANNIGKVKGLNDFKKALNEVSLNYPNIQEGKDAEAFVTKDIAAMEALQFNLEKPLSYKLVYRLDCNNDINAKPILDKLTKFLNKSIYTKLKSSTDLYLMEEDFIVIHNVKDESQAKDIISILRDYKEYQIVETPIIISSSNYKIIQIKKNLDEYLKDPNKVAVPVDRKAATAREVSKEAPEAIKKLIKENQTRKDSKSMAPPGSLPVQEMQENDEPELISRPKK